MSGVEHLIVDNGLRLHVLDYGGDGRPVLFLHGVLGSAWMWHGVAPGLTDQARVWSMDLRGYGDSQWSAGEHYSTRDHAADVIDVIDALPIRIAQAADGHDGVTIIGFSWGGLIGLAVAQARPELVRALVMVDLPPSTDRSPTELPPVPMTVANHRDAVAAEIAVAPNIPAALADTIAAASRRPGLDGTLVRKHDPYFTSFWPFRDEDWWPALESVERPILLLRATNSPVLSASDAAAMSERANDLRVVEVTDTGHLVPVEQPEAATAAIAQFLEDA